jgi:hypothetical protein
MFLYRPLNDVSIPKAVYKGCKPDVKKAVLTWATDGAGIRAIVRE